VEDTAYSVFQLSIPNSKIYLFGANSNGLTTLSRLASRKSDYNSAADYALQNVHGSHRVAFLMAQTVSFHLTLAAHLLIANLASDRDDTRFTI